MRSIAESSVADNSQAPLFSGGNKPLSQTGQATTGSGSSSTLLGSIPSSTFGRLTGGGRSKVSQQSSTHGPACSCFLCLMRSPCHQSESSRPP